MASALGVRLRRLREAKKLTLQQVADAAGCTKAYIWELEMKDGQRPSAERVQALAKVLGVTMEDIMGEPIQKVPEASLEDVAFFREYAGMTEEEKRHYQDVLKMMFSRKSGD
ncbi:MAG: helix-turn-helix transcriptional regulator [Sulfurimicrobium sp.]|jgi:transcriptional regulator with XRE-family HTH domain|uniref:Transcriptional regulator n=1 Tax=Sulfurimicrobium lacus TaxID=2715678 RepID=A0A6F8VGH4_9PROT|nr:helix-turn-helix transcriptional regulator [Sulfurimicrobium lacus]MDO8892366.1 helix-turn-helix transcriptional regulator [Sulfurimicrobium sp.]MDP2198408.1 helix-turn-helix transcriptional regulator [Sulfurimicrobium sp.]MDP3689229.1 helix-turn-helix transcriptional regulator [Sulfurimicrobium sp.]BCB28207.1 transcriptional regulator [Sulfurimicrobium lacus]